MSLHNEPVDPLPEAPRQPDSAHREASKKEKQDKTQKGWPKVLPIVDVKLNKLYQPLTSFFLSSVETFRGCVVSGSEGCLVLTLTTQYHRGLRGRGTTHPFVVLENNCRLPRTVTRLSPQRCRRTSTEQLQAHLRYTEAKQILPSRFIRKERCVESRVNHRGR